MSEVISRVVELFDSTCVKQFESMKCDIRSEKIDALYDMEAAICAFISCYSDDLEINLIISASEGFLASTIPLTGGQRLESESFLKDWCLELANRFLGRLKNKLLSHGCTLSMGLPILVVGHDMATRMANAHPAASRAFKNVLPNAEHQIHCDLFVKELNPDFSLDDYEDEDEDWFDESELQHL